MASNFASRRKKIRKNLSICAAVKPNENNNEPEEDEMLSAKVGIITGGVTVPPGFNVQIPFDTTAWDYLGAASLPDGFLISKKGIYQVGIKATIEKSNFPATHRMYIIIQGSGSAGQLVWSDLSLIEDTNTSRKFQDENLVTLDPGTLIQLFATNNDPVQDLIIQESQGQDGMYIALAQLLF